MRRLFPLACLLSGAFAIATSVAGCGYKFQGSHNQLLEQEGVRRIFVAPLVNNTYKAGAENVVYNALVRVLGAGQRVTLVHKAEEADAILSGLITSASYTGTSAVPVRDITPAGIPTVHSDVQVVNSYNAVLECVFSLTRRIVPEGKKALIWQAGFSRAKGFPSAVRVGVAGTTTALINESEFERALSDLASDMMADVHESMMAQF